MATKVYRPGERVPKSGIYQVAHNGHRGNHEALLTESTVFPRCRGCGDQVSYELMRGASPIETDRDFSKHEPSHEA